MPVQIAPQIGQRTGGQLHHVPCHAGQVDSNRRRNAAASAAQIQQAGSSCAAAQAEHFRHQYLRILPRDEHALPHGKRQPVELPRTAEVLERFVAAAAAGHVRQRFLLRLGERPLRQGAHRLAHAYHLLHQNIALKGGIRQTVFCQNRTCPADGFVGGHHHLSSSMSAGMHGFRAAMAHSICEASGSRVVMRWIWSPGHERARVSQLLLRPAMRMNS